MWIYVRKCHCPTLHALVALGGPGIEVFAGIPAGVVPLAVIWNPVIKSQPRGSHSAWPGVAGSMV